VKRRTFLLAAAGAGGALVLGWSLVPPRQRLHPRATIPARDGRLVLNGWVAIAPDDTVTAVLPKAEMGQGIHTALAMVLAEELDVPLERVRVEMAPVDAIYHNLVVGRDALPLPASADPRLRRLVHWFSDKLLREAGVMMTGGSSSVRDTWEPLGDAAALARATLVGEAARRWQVDPAACTVEAGVIRHGDRTLRYGALVADGAPLPPATRVIRKAPSSYRLVGRATPRLDAREKATGRARFGVDARPDGLLHAALALPPTIGGRVRHLDEAAALASPGVRAVVALSGRNGGPPGVAVVATSWWLARRGVEALAVQWDDGPHATLTSDAVRAALRAQARAGGGRVFRDAGGAAARIDAARAAGGTVVEAEYDVPYLAHATLEPPNCTVRVADGRAEVWVGTQVPKQARAAAAAALGLAPERVTLHLPFLGGGFGRRLEVDMVGQAAEIARAVPGTPVQVLWSREDDLRHDFLRPAAAAHATAALAADGSVAALAITTASQEITRPYGRRSGMPLARFDVRKAAVEGLIEQPYAFGALRVTHALATHPVPVGFWRGVGHTFNAFFLESLVDELAHAAGADPLAFRARLAAPEARALAVLALVRRASGWDTPPAPAADGAPVARGVALHRSFGSLVAQVAEVSLAADGAPRVHRVTCALDCGLAINPDGIAQQVEGAVAFGLSAALWGDARIVGGRMEAGNFDAVRLLRLAEMPVVTTHLVPSGDPPEGVGEVAVPPVAPAVANALFALTGERARQLPLAARPWRARGAAPA
jgi:isoquinoline 1-oxidoreductase beta subunit